MDNPNPAPMDNFMENCAPMAKFVKITIPPPHIKIFMDNPNPIPRSYCMYCIDVLYVLKTLPPPLMEKSVWITKPHPLVKCMDNPPS